MTDIDPRTLELIHAELDDELDAAGRADLAARLSADPPARLQRDQLQRMAHSLAMLAPVEPPAGLRQRWQTSSPGTPRLAAPRRSSQRRWIGRGVAMAAVTLAVAFGLSLTDIGRQTLDGRQVVGTIGGTAVGADPAHVLPVQADGLSGTVALEPGNSGWDLVFDLETAVPISVSATYDPAVLRLESYARAGSGDRSLTASPGKVEFVNQGTQHLSLHLHPGEGGQVRIRFEGQEGILQDLAITVPAGVP